MKKEWTDDMGEISGFGGYYEATCREMVLAGIAWLDEHPDADLQFGGCKNVYGLVTDASPDAKALTKAVIDASGGGATDAMHHAAVIHCLAYKRLGWDEYRSQLVNREPSRD